MKPREEKRVSCEIKGEQRVGEREVTWEKQRDVGEGEGEGHTAKREREI